MADDNRLTQFKSALKDSQAALHAQAAASHGSADNSKFTTHKRATSSKKLRLGKKKSKNGRQENLHQALYNPVPSHLRQVYQKLPTGGAIQSYTSQNSIMTPTTSKDAQPLK